MKAEVRILLVEDEFLIALNLEQELVGIGYRVIKIVNNGEEAIEITMLGDLDVILMDIGLAGSIDGIEAARQIELFSKTPIIFMSGYANKLCESSDCPQNSIGYLTKPVFINDLKSILDTYFMG
ncbi:MAG: response regulator [Spirochaetia bacterium]|jgi:CheY-like chemotaxis protein|nr:response regulator [Spirochaetia bacterium]